MPALQHRSKKSAEYRGVPLWRIVIQAVNARAEQLVPLWLPDGRKEGYKYWARNPTRPDRSLGSFCIVIAGSRQGTWRDFATGDSGGNLVSLFCYINGGDHSNRQHFNASIKSLAGFLKIDGLT